MHDIFLMFYAWLMAATLQILAMPILVPRLRKDLFDGGWAFGRLFSLLGMGLPLWLLGQFHAPGYSLWGMPVVFLFWAFLSLSQYHRLKDDLLEFLEDHWKWVVIEEGVFAAGFFFMAAVRAFGPDILDLEKFMDAGLMASYLRAETLPVLDMWWAGSVMNYYTFGHFLGAFMTRYWAMALPQSYNLLLALITGMAVVQAFSLISHLIYAVSDEDRRRWPLVLGGLWGAVLIFFGGNTHTVWYGLKNHNWTGYWYPDATRFIPHTIHEFPAYSLVVGDLHAHVWDFPVVLFLLALIALWYRSVLVAPACREIYRLAALLGLVWGVAVMTNAWDGAIYALVLAAAAVSLAIFQTKRWFHILASLVLSGAVAGALSSTWWLNFESIAEGAALVSEGSPLWRLVILWSGWSVLSASAFLVANHQNRALLLSAESVRCRKQAVLGFIMALVFSGWILIILPELFYVKDIYVGDVRANTMFKMILQSVILMGVSAGWVAGYIWRDDFIPHNQARKVVRVLIFILLLVVSGAHLLFPFFAYRDRFEKFRHYKGLDGLRWLKERYPDDYAALSWLGNQAAGQPVVLEAVGTSYSDFSRVSAFTGLPTVVGWPVHEWLWRGSYDVVGPRVEEVRKMYTDPFSPETAALYERYGVEYIFAGAKERQAYPGAALGQLRLFGEVVFEQGGTFVVQRTRSVLPPVSQMPRVNTGGCRK